MPVITKVTKELVIGYSHDFSYTYIKRYCVLSDGSTKIVYATVQNNVESTDDIEPWIDIRVDES